MFRPAFFIVRAFPRLPVEAEADRRARIGIDGVVGLCDLHRNPVGDRHDGTRVRIDVVEKRLYPTSD